MPETPDNMQVPTKEEYLQKSSLNGLDLIVVRDAIAYLTEYIDDMQYKVDNSNPNDLLIKIYKERIAFLRVCKKLAAMAVETEAINKELSDCLYSMVSETCQQGSIFNSRGISAYADAMRILAKKKRFRIKTDYCKLVIAEDNSLAMRRIGGRRGVMGVVE